MRYVFVVTGKVGLVRDWGGPGVPLLDWGDIWRLYHEGVEFGSHTQTHRSLLSLSAGELVAECAESRLALESALDTRVSSFAYPYGESDAASAHLVGGCGFEAALGKGFDLSRYSDHPLNLPRITITAQDDLRSFARKIGSESNSEANG